MVYRVDNRPKKHQGRILFLGIFLGIVITVGGYYWFENTPNLIRMAGQVSANVTNTSEYNSGLHALQKLTNQVKSLSPIQTQQPTTDLHSIALQIHDLVNKEREKNHITDLVWDDSIANVALLHSKDMILNNYVGHIDLQGNNPIVRVEQAGINCNGYTGENIETLYGYSPTEVSQNTIDDWMNDSGHRMNLLGSGYTREGIGIFENNDRTSVTEDFC